MNFSLSKEQTDIKRAAREFAEGEFTPETAMELDLNHESRKIANVIHLFTSMVKHHVPETAKWIIDEAMTVFGGYGYFLDQEVERRYRDNRIAEVYEGTVEVQLNNMVRMLKRLNPEFINVNLL